MTLLLLSQTICNISREVFIGNVLKINIYQNMFFIQCVPRKGVRNFGTAVCVLSERYIVYIHSVHQEISLILALFESHIVYLQYTFSCHRHYLWTFFIFICYALFNIFRTKNTKINTLQLLLLFKYRKNLDFVCGIWHIFRSFL